MLEEDRIRITEEEMIREVARQILADERKRQEKERRSKGSLRKRTGAFFQTTLGTGLVIWFLTSVVVAVLSWGFANWRTHETAIHQREDAISHMNIEVASRLRALNTQINSELNRTNASDYYPDSLAAGIIYDFITSSPEKAAASKWPIVNLYPTYNNLSILGLENNLEAISSEKQQAQAKSAINVLSAVSDNANRFHGLPNPTKEEVRNFLINTREALKSPSLPQGVPAG
jgi:hypothetical protein